VIESDGLEPGLEELRGLVRADGSDLALIDVDGDTIRLRLLIEDTTRADCVMPRPFLEDLALDILQRAVPTVRRVEIDDPREAADADTP
jgi:hypothetical protein